MKQAVALILMLVVLLSATSCSVSPKTEQAEKPTVVKTDAELAATIDNKLADIKYDGVIYLAS